VGQIEAHVDDPNDDVLSLVGRRERAFAQVDLVGFRGGQARVQSGPHGASTFEASHRGARGKGEQRALRKLDGHDIACDGVHSTPKGGSFPSCSVGVVRFGEEGHIAGAQWTRGRSRRLLEARAKGCVEFAVGCSSVAGPRGRGVGAASKPQGNKKAHENGAATSS
jgi:hypothetical protein